MRTDRLPGSAAVLSSRSRTSTQEGRTIRSRTQQQRSNPTTSSAPRPSARRSAPKPQHHVVEQVAGVLQTLWNSIRTVIQFLSRGRTLRIMLGLAIFVAAALYFLYPSARDYYVSIRQHDRIELEHKLLEERHQALEKKVDRLNTSEGVEDLAHQEFGWVKEGENALKVNGVDTDRAKDLNADVPASSVAAPTTWYSGFLDPIFGYNPQRTDMAQ